MYPSGVVAVYSNPFSVSVCASLTFWAVLTVYSSSSFMFSSWV